MVDGRFVFDGDQVAIDGDEVEYESLCADCYLTSPAAGSTVETAADATPDRGPPVRCRGLGMHACRAALPTT